jgi:hypothetical protein
MHTGHWGEWAHGTFANYSFGAVHDPQTPDKFEEWFRGLPRSAVVLLSLGLNDQLNAKKIKSQIVDPFTEFLDSRACPAGAEVNKIFMTTKASGALKPKQYLPRQSIEAVLAFNKEIVPLVEQKGWAILDVFNMTAGTHSYDGTHYGTLANAIIVQVLLNHLHALGLKEDARSV